MHYERDYQNPIYFDVGPNSTNLTANTDQMYEGLYSETTLVSDTIYESANDSVPQEYLVPEITTSKRHSDHGTSRVNHGGTMGGTTSETMYGAGTSQAAKDDTCYSVLGTTDYCTLQPHIPKPKQQQRPPTDDEYSQLRHL